MNWDLEDENKIKRYLLDGLPVEMKQQVEESLLRDDDYADLLLVIEDELIDDYVRGALSETERQLFIRNFLLTPLRRQKLAIAEELAVFARTQTLEASSENIRPQSVLAVKTSDAGLTGPDRKEGGEKSDKRRFSLWRMLTTPRWKIVAYAVLALVAVLINKLPDTPDNKSDLTLAMKLLDQAYARQRPLEARITGLGYAPFPVIRGNESEIGDYTKLDEADVLLRKAVREKNNAASLYPLGKFYLARKEFDKAIAQFEGAMKMGLETAELYNDLGVALYGKGLAQRLASQSGESEITLARSLECLSKALDKNPLLLEARFNRALLFESLGLPNQARADWQKYLTADSNSPWAEESRRHLGEIEEKEKKRSRREETLYRDFLFAYQQQDDERLWDVFSRSHFRTGNSIARALIENFLAHEKEDPVTSIADDLAMLRRIGNIAVQRAGERYFGDLAAFYGRASSAKREQARQGRALADAAYEAQHKSEYQKAIELYARAESRFEQAGVPGEGLFVKYWMGWCYFRQSDMSQCLNIFTNLAQQSERRGYLWLQALSLHGLSYTHEALGDYSRSLEACQSSRRLTEQLHDGNGTLRSLTRLANLYQLLGQHQQSLRYVQLGLALAQTIQADGSQVIGLHSPAALSFKETGHYYAALEHERESVVLCQGINDLVEMSRSDVRLGQIYSRLRRYTDAVEAIQRGISIGNQLKPARIGDEVTNFALLSLGDVYRQSGRLTEAVNAFEQVISFFKQSDEHLMLYTAYKGKLLCRIALGDVAASQQELHQLLDELEMHRKRILEDTNRHTFFDTEQGVYDVAISFASGTLKDVHKAFEYSELCRARSLWDAAQGGKKVVREGASYDLRFPGSAKPVDLPALQREIPEKVRILQYAVLEDRISVWVVGRKLFKYWETKVQAELINAKIKSFRDKLSIAQKDPDEPLLAEADELYNLLIAPIKPLLEEGETLCIVPDKILNLLPFGALFSKHLGKYLIEDYLILYAPSSTMFLFCTRAANEKVKVGRERLLSVGNPSFNGKDFPMLLNLPSAEREANAITRHYSSYGLLTGKQAQEAVVKKEMLESEIIHFALHHIADDKAPLYSKLVLAEPSGHRTDSIEDGLLSAYELYGLSFARTRLVVLSACQTRADAYYKGEGVVGMSRPFEAAGVPLVVSSLWPVDSDATSELMIRFHAIRSRPGTSTIKALRGAQLELVHHQNLWRRAPYYWAAFVVVGGYSEF